jgi:outer membrane lipoprotein-sorting protein
MPQEKGGEKRMTFKKQLMGLVLALALVPVAGYAAEEKMQEKNGTIQSYDKESRMVTVKGKDWEQKAKVSSGDAKDKADLLKEGTKVKVLFDDRGGGDIRVKTIEGR